MAENTPFNPSAHLRTVQGGQAYLDVKWRKLWFIEQNPRYTIETVPHILNETVAIFRTTIAVMDEDGAVVRRVDGWASETPQGFKDFIEKSATSSIGRALDNLGYGTSQATEDDKLADAPVGGSQPQGQTRPAAAPGNAPTEAQVRLLYSLAKERGMDEADVKQEMQDRFGVDSLKRLDRRQMSAWIDSLKALAPDAAPEAEKWTERHGYAAVGEEVPF